MAKRTCVTASITPQHSCQIALDRMRDGVYFLDADGLVLFANRQAQAIEATGQLLRRAGGALASVRRADDKLLQLALSSTLLAGPFGDAQTLRLHGRGNRLAGLVTLCAAASTDGLSSEPMVVAMAFVKALNMPRPSSGQELQRALGLTGAECKLAGLLMQGLSLEKAAIRLSVSKNTVRSQLRGLFDRTGARRQAELVSLLFQVI